MSEQEQPQAQEPVFYCRDILAMTRDMRRKGIPEGEILNEIEDRSLIALGVIETGENNERGAEDEQQ